MIRVSGLSTLSSPATSLVDVSFDVPDGAITSLVGSPGRPASTVVDLVVGFAKPSAGLVQFDGRPLARWSQPRKVVGVVTPQMGAHPRRTVRDHLRWIAASANLGAVEVSAALDLTGLTPVAETLAGELASSFVQRVNVAAAVIATPKNLVLCQQFDGLDAESTGWLKRYLRHLAAAGHAILVATDPLDDAASIADRTVTIGSDSVVSVVEVPLVSAMPSSSTDIATSKGW
jgi:ABC-2 type transport system ATP-binding protein